MSEPYFDQYRRRFFSKAVGVTSALLPLTALPLAEGSVVKSTSQNVPPSTQALNADKVVGKATPAQSKRLGMLIDTEQLQARIHDCIDACKQEHGWGQEALADPAQAVHWIRVVKATHKVTGEHSHLPVMCQHCEHAPCIDVCPTSASFKRKDGVVLVDKHLCIGCRYCMMACPYKARSFVHTPLDNQLPDTPRGKGTVESCNLCVHRTDKGQQPACVEASDGAMVWGDLHDPSSGISQALQRNAGKQLRADLGLNTGLRYWGI